MKYPRIIITFAVDFFCLVLVLFLPGQATIASLLGIITMNGLNLLSEQFRGESKAQTVLNICILGFIAILAVCLIILLALARIISSASNIYYIAWNEDLIFVGGTMFSYTFFFIAAFVIGLVLQISNLIKSLVIASRPRSWDEVLQRQVK